MGLGLRVLPIACVVVAVVLLTQAPTYYWVFSGALVSLIGWFYYILLRAPVLDLNRLSPAARDLYERYSHAISAPMLTRLTRALVGAFKFLTIIGAGWFVFHSQWLQGSAAVILVLLSPYFSGRIDPTAYVSRVAGAEANREIGIALITENGSKPLSDLTKELLGLQGNTSSPSFRPTGEKCWPSATCWTNTSASA